jgi:hypothetical protein
MLSASKYDLEFAISGKEVEPPECSLGCGMFAKKL